MTWKTAQNAVSHSVHTHYRVHERKKKERDSTNVTKPSTESDQAQFTLADLLRQSVYSRLAGYEDLNDAERVSIDPTFRLIGSQKIWDRGAALTSTLHGFETEMLASEENLLGLMALNRELVGQAEAFDDSERV